MTRPETLQGQQKSGGIWSSISSLVGSKQLSSKDVEPVIAKMQEHLVAKNVAAEVAEGLCKSVANKLEGKVMGMLCSIISSHFLTTSQSFCSVNPLRQKKSVAVRYLHRKEHKFKE